MNQSFECKAPARTAAKADFSVAEKADQCSVEDMKSWVLGNMQDYYLFYDELPQANPVQYEGAEDYVRALRVAPYDRYSYVTDQATSSALFEDGQRFGFGMRVKRSNDDRLYFSLIEPLSPLGRANVARGDEILAINNVTPENFTADFITAAFGGENECIDISFTIREARTSNQRTVTVTKNLYDVQTVLDAKVIQENNQRIGYLNFLTFLETSAAELDTAFSLFKSEGIDELVLDLRHNLGGRISIAEKLGSHIAGRVVENAAFTRVTFNDKYAYQDDAYPYQLRENSLDLPRVYVLTSPDTCSASEMVITSLRPFIEVITVGDTTCGKPYGTLARNHCGKSMHALEVEFQNENYVGGYYDGLTATCPATEDLSEALGNPSENLMRTALFHAKNGQCLTGFAVAQRKLLNKNPVFVKHSEGPELMNPSYDEIRNLFPQ